MHHHNPIGAGGNHPAADSIVKFLNHAKKRDQEKGGTGIRDTSEIAESCQLPKASCRKHLHELAQKGVVEWYGALPDSGNAHHWKISDELQIEEQPGLDMTSASDG